MKRIWIGLLFVSGLGLNTSAFAAEAADELRVTVGIKTWVNTWETWDATSSAGRLESSTTGNKLAAIPNISLGYGDFYASVGYSTRTNYRFPNYTSDTSLNNNLQAKREETDVNVGYWILQGQAGGRIGVSLGYKEVNQYFKNADFDTPFDKYKYKGWTVGIIGSAPISNGWNVYGSGAIGPTRLQSKIPSSSGSYVSTEIGIAYPLADKATISLGYKVQIIDVKVFGQRARDSTNGLIAGLNYTF